MNFRRFIGKCRSAYYIILAKANPSFSQAGEDQIVRNLFETIGIPKPTYLDVGCNHPFVGNNTYYFYQRGCSGVCVEPNPAYYTLFKRHRSRDIFLQIGIGVNQSAEASLYIFPSPYSGWNTFSKEEAVRRQKEAGVSILQIKKVPLETINFVMEVYFDPYPNFFSIDVEGMDLAILRSLDFSRFRPEVICVETIAFEVHNKGPKLDEIILFLEEKEYFVFADTHINTIFCRKDTYKNKMI